MIEIFCKKTLIGKTFWKGVALPSSFMRKQVANLNLTQVNEIQTIENGLYKKKKLGAANGTVLETMRGYIGASLMESIIMENKMKNLEKYEER